LFDVWGSIFFGLVYCLGGIFFLSGLADLCVVLNVNIWISNFSSALRVIGTGALKLFSGVFLIGFVIAPGGFVKKYRWRLRYLMRDIVRYRLNSIRNDNYISKLYFI